MKKPSMVSTDTMNSTKVIHRRDIYKEARSYAKQYVRQYSLLLMIVIIINLINSGFDPQSQKTMTEQMQTTTAVLSIVLSLASAWLSMGFIVISLKLLDHKHVIFSDGIIDLNKTAKAFLANILVSLFSLGGFILLIIPGIIIQTRLMFVTTLILDKNLEIWAAIKTSRVMTKGSVRNLVVLSIVTGLAQILGILTLCVGLFRTIPFMILAQTLAYRALRDKE